MWRWWLGYFVILIAAADDETSCWLDDNSLLQHPGKALTAQALLHMPRAPLMERLDFTLLLILGILVLTYCICFAHSRFGQSRSRGMILTDGGTGR